MHVEGKDPGLIRVLSQHLPRGAEEEPQSDWSISRIQDRSVASLSILFCSKML
jgi:hypothetical protein